MTNLAQKLFNYDCEKELTIVINDYRNWYGWDEKRSGIIFSYTLYLPYTEKIIHGDTFISDERVWYPGRDTFNLAVVLDAINQQEKLWKTIRGFKHYVDAKSISVVPQIDNLDRDSLSHVMCNMFNKPVYIIEC
jgi:hypothetical protein